MNKLSQPSRAVRQPQQIPIIDWSNTITKDMAFCYVLGTVGASVGYILNGSQLVPYNAYTTETVNSYGKAAQTNGYIQDTSQTGMTGTNYSLLAVGNCTSTTATQNAIDDDTGTTRCFQFRITTAKTELITFNTGNSPFFATSAALSASDLSKGFVMGATVAGNSIAAFQNGVKTSATATGTPRAPTGIFRIGAYKGSGSQNWFTGGLNLVVGWSRTLSDAEMRSLSENPWQIFKGTLKAVSPNNSTGPSTISTNGQSNAVATSNSAAVAIWKTQGQVSSPSISVNSNTKSIWNVQGQTDIPNVTVSAIANILYNTQGQSPVTGIVVNSNTNSICNVQALSNSVPSVSASASTIKLTLSESNNSTSSIIALTNSIWNIQAGSQASSSTNSQTLAFYTTNTYSEGISTVTGNTSASEYKNIIGSSEGTSSSSGSTINIFNSNASSQSNSFVEAEPRTVYLTNVDSHGYSNNTSITSALAVAYTSTELHPEDGQVYVQALSNTIYATSGHTNGSSSITGYSTSDSVLADGNILKLSFSKNPYSVKLNNTPYGIQHTVIKFNVR